ncbi:MAG: pyrroline-5-carboxylate reductase [Humidesulfovibrio sp.]|jgi:pyrroline-5-carboxylate reductase|uniref:pyrroline-5-carboxylate reductase n=1 Tax=Humidesulfovibrio sp. TaxID=2910988 RepID=UPI0027331D0A|nr:pyrroline-5-carboxylate reductase [Humidesulfovibrio sp.]MDP2847978.1 pyrroline-5-carboxylate reductase [Humidesulfovibrio sp.]
MKQSVGFIGVGNMGTAIIKGLAAQKLEVHGCDLNKEKLEILSQEVGLKIEATPRDLVKKCRYVLLAVKPQHLAGVLADLAPDLTTEHCLLSIAAGVTMTRLKELSGGLCPVVRIMPNTPALVGAGVFALCFDDPDLDEERREFLRAMHKPLGQVHELPEKLFDAFTSVAGCGPAYVFYVMDAIVEAGVNLGLPRAQSTEIVKALFSGSAKLAEEGGLHLAELREMVTSPAGSTIRATMHFDRMAMRGIIIDAVSEAYDRNIELG